MIKNQQKPKNFQEIKLEQQTLKIIPALIQHSGKNGSSEVFTSETLQTIREEELKKHSKKTTA